MNKKKQPVITATEWIVSAIGFVIVAGAVVFLAISAIRHDGSPASITLEIDTIYRTEGGYVARVEARNTGAETASHLELEASLLDSAGNVTEQSSLTLDYLPGESMRTGAFIFRTDPARGRLELRPRGYESP